MMNEAQIVVGIGGAAGDGVASAGNTLVLSLARQGLPVFAYNSYQSVIRRRAFLVARARLPEKPLNHGDQVDALIALNQDTLGPPSSRAETGRPRAIQRRQDHPSYESPPGSGCVRCRYPS